MISITVTNVTRLYLKCAWCASYVHRFTMHRENESWQILNMAYHAPLDFTDSDL